MAARRRRPDVCPKEQGGDWRVAPHAETLGLQIEFDDVFPAFVDGDRFLVGTDPDRLVAEIRLAKRGGAWEQHG